MNLKKIYTCLAVSVIAVGLCSCEKNYTCVCNLTIYNPVNGSVSTGQDITTIKNTKSNAEYNCKERGGLLENHYTIAHCALK